MYSFIYLWISVKLNASVDHAKFLSEMYYNCFFLFFSPLFWILIFFNTVLIKEDSRQGNERSSETPTQERDAHPVVHFNFCSLYIKTIHRLCSHMSLLKIE